MSNLFKKVTASVAAAAVVFSVVAPVVGVSADSTSSDAAARLAALGVITAQTSDAGYKLDSTISRREMLKVMMNLSSVEVTDTCEGKFSDLPASDWGCKYAEAALKAGFIAPNAKFRPADAVSEAEALKMIMQAKGIAKTEGVANWADAYLSAAIEAGIVAEGTTLKAAPAKRGMVFVVADSAVTADVGSDEDDLGLDLGDLLGGDEDDMDSTDETSSGNTSTDGSTPVVVGGDVEVSLNPASAANGTQIPNNGTIRFAKVDFTAGDKDVSLNTVELKSEGLAAVASSTRVWFELNGKRLSGKAAFSSDRTAVVSFAPAYVVKAGSTSTLDLYVELSTDAGNDFQFSGKIASSSAANNNGSFVTSTLRTATYTVAPVTFDKGGATSTYNQSVDAVELGRFTVQNKDLSSETRDVAFQTVTLRQNGNGDLADLSDLMVERNGVKVSSEVFTNGKDVTFVLNDTVKDGATATYYIKAKVVNVQNNAGDTYEFALRNTTDLNAVEVLNGYRSTVTITSGTLNTYTITGSDLKLERDSSVELSRNYAKGTNNVVLLQGTITTKSPITLEDPSLTYTSSTGANVLFDTIYLQIGSSTMTWSASSSTGVTGTAAFLGLATVNSSAQVKIYAKLRDNAPAANFNLADLRLSSFAKAEYVSNQNTVSTAVGTISAVKVTVDSTALSITRVDGLGDTKIAVGSKAVSVNGLNVAVTQGNDVQISNAEYTISGSGSFSNNAFATLYVDGTAVSTKTISGTGVKFDGLNKIVGKTAVNLTVKVDFSDAYDNGQFKVTLSKLDIVDSLTSQAVALGSVPSSANFTVAAAKGTLSVSDSNPKASLLLAGSKDQKVLAFRLKAENDTVKFRDLVFTGTNLSNLSNFRLLTPTNSYVASTSNSGTAVEFTNLSLNDGVAMDKTETYYLVADMNTNVNDTFAVTLSGAKVKGTNGTVVDAIGGSITSNTHLVVENSLVVSKDTNTNKSRQNAMIVSITASGKDSVVLSGSIFTAAIVDAVGYTSTGTVKMYKDSVAPSNEVTVSANNTIDAGSTVKFVLEISGAVLDNTFTGTPSIQIELSDLQTSNIASVKAYDNTGLKTKFIEQIK